MTRSSDSSCVPSAALAGALAALVLVLAAAPVRAGQPIYDGFDDSPGQSLDQQSSGTNFSSAWIANSDYLIGGGSLGFGGLLTSGNCVNFSEPNLSGSQAQRSILFSGVGAAGTTRWMSFLIRPDLTGANHIFAVALDSLSIGKGSVTDPDFYEIGSGPSAIVSGVPIVPGTTVFVAVKLEFNANPNLADAVTVYFDPTPGLAAPDVGGLSDPNENFAAAVSAFSALAANGMAFSFDELRIGDNYTDVAPTGVQNWFNLGSAKQGSGSFAPHLTGSGPLSASSANHLDLTSPYASTSATLVFGPTAINVPFKGGTLVPQPLLLVPLATDPAGSLTLPFIFPTGVPAGVALYFQFWIHDTGTTSGLAASNAVKGVTQ